MKDVFERMNKGEVRKDRVIGYRCMCCGHFQGEDWDCENCGGGVTPVESNENLIEMETGNRKREAGYGRK